MWGIIAIIFASFGTLFENLIQLVNIIGSIFYGTILGIFSNCFFLLKKIKGNEVFWSACISQMLIFMIYIFGRYWLLMVKLYWSFFNNIFLLFIKFLNEKRAIN